MNRFEDHLWSDLVTEHGGRLRDAHDATAALAATLDDQPLRPTRRRMVVRLAAAVAVTLTAVGAALALGLVGARAPAHGTIRTPGTIQTPSYTLVSDTSGAVMLTINPKELFDAEALQSDLARYGIPAKVTTGSFRSSDPAPAGFAQVVTPNPVASSRRRREPMPSRPSRSIRRPSQQTRSSASATSSYATTRNWRPWR